MSTEKPPFTQFHFIYPISISDVCVSNSRKQIRGLELNYSMRNGVNRG